MRTQFAVACLFLPYAFVAGLFAGCGSGDEETGRLTTCNLLCQQHQTQECNERYAPAEFKVTFDPCVGWDTDVWGAYQERTEDDFWARAVRDMPRDAYLKAVSELRSCYKREGGMFVPTTTDELKDEARLRPEPCSSECEANSSKEEELRHYARTHCFPGR